jgi:uncharacterized protein YndB with AHSA1/START domain
MAEILHKITIAAPPAAVYAALTEELGLARWWTEKVQAEPKIGAVCRFRFDADTGPDMEVAGLDRAKRVHWRCVKHGPDPKHEWVGTELFFELEPEGANTVLRFSHRRWPEGSDFMRYCSMKWATYLLGLKGLLEGGEGTPYPRDAEI